MRFFIRIFISPYLHQPDSHILNKSFPKKIFCKVVQLHFEISLLSFIHKIFEQNFYLHTTVYLVRIWTYKNADEKAHTFSRRSKNVKKRTKTYEKRILCKFTFTVAGSLATLPIYNNNNNTVVYGTSRVIKLHFKALCFVFKQSLAF